MLQPELSELAAYVPHRGGFEVRLDANEAPPLLPDSAKSKLAACLQEVSYNRYPDPEARDLRDAIASVHGASASEVVVGVGSDEVIALLLTTLSRGRDGRALATILAPAPTFVMYKQSARVRGQRVVEVPLDGEWDLDVSAMKRAIELTRPNIIFIASPNNPTGNVMSEERIRALIDAAQDALIVLDEAYVAFAESSLECFRSEYPNVAIMKTLSKIGFAALRIGWLVAPEGLVREIDKVRQPYNLPAFEQLAATVVLKELQGDVRMAAKRIVEERDRMSAELSRLGYLVTKSSANFVWTRTNKPAAEVFEALCQRGILVRSFHKSGGRLANQLRITVGLPDENDRFLGAMAECV